MKPERMSAPETNTNGAPCTSRSTFLKTMLGILAGTFLLPKRSRAEPVQTAPQPNPKHQRKWGMVIDLDKCAGCRCCVVACRLENNVPVAGPEQSEMDRGIFWMDMLSTREGEYEGLQGHFIPTPCNHCEAAPCVKVCPVGATFINEEGIVGQIWARCIGCRYCTTACPYTRRYFNWFAPNWPEELKNQLNPDVATRPKGVVEKCTFCHHRLRKIRAKARRENRDVTDSEVRKLPACAESCPTDAIVFGDLNDLQSEVARLARSPRAKRLQEELGTHPKVIYLGEKKWQE